MRRGLSDELVKLTDGAVQSFRSVKLIDIEPESRLNFDTVIYLPLNDRYIKYSSSGDIFEGERLSQLKKHKMKAIFVPSDQIQEFYKYTGARLSELSHSLQVSETERSEKLRNAVRDLMGGIFKDEADLSSSE